MRSDLSDLARGREPTAGDLLDRHLRRTGADRSADREPMSHVQVTMLGYFLTVLEAALADEHVEPSAARRVIERVIYGAVPQPPVVEARLAEQAEWVRRMSVMQP
jgi:hypothetical protein